MSAAVINMSDQVEDPPCGGCEEPERALAAAPHHPGPGQVQWDPSETASAGLLPTNRQHWRNGPGVGVIYNVIDSWRALVLVGGGAHR
jgi:hypothetical protein